MVFSCRLWFFFCDSFVGISRSPNEWNAVIGAFVGFDVKDKTKDAYSIRNAMDIKLVFLCVFEARQIIPWARHSHKGLSILIFKAAHTHSATAYTQRARLITQTIVDDQHDSIYRIFNISISFNATAPCLQLNSFPRIVHSLFLSFFLLFFVSFRTFTESLNIYVICICVCIFHIETEKKESKPKGKNWSMSETYEQTPHAYILILI